MTSDRHAHRLPPSPADANVYPIQLDPDKVQVKGCRVNFDVKVLGA